MAFSVFKNMVDSNPSISSLSALRGELGGEDAEEDAVVVAVVKKESWAVVMVKKKE